MESACVRPLRALEKLAAPIERDVAFLSSKFSPH
jgi:hypothetical protein